MQNESKRIGIHIKTLLAAKDPVAALKTVCKLGDITVCYGAESPGVSKQLDEMAQKAGVVFGKLAADSDDCREQVKTFLTKIP